MVAVLFFCSDPEVRESGSVWKNYVSEKGNSNPEIYFSGEIVRTSDLQCGGLGCRVWLVFESCGFGNRLYHLCLSWHISVGPIHHMPKMPSSDGSQRLCKFVRLNNEKDRFLQTQWPPEYFRKESFYRRTIWNPGFPDLLAVLKFFNIDGFCSIIRWAPALSEDAFLQKLSE